MNIEILKSEVQEFINNNLQTNINKLILKGSPFKNITIQELANQIIAKQKSKHKLPSWFNTSNIFYPSKLNIEQTSSEITANYKLRLINGKSIIDLTGGFGVDSFYFSKTFDQVIHCEIDEYLSEIANHNFNKLQNNNIKTVSTNGIEFLINTNNNYDFIYADPCRRNDKKGKVFLFRDCLPNIPDNLDLLFSKSNNVLIKSSPILDISQAINELEHVKEVHILAVKNEVKELLFLLEKSYDDKVLISTHNITKDTTDVFSFIKNDETNAIYDFPKKYIYEPNAAILKSGGFQQVSIKFDISKLHQNSHLYTSEKFIEKFPGRSFKILNSFLYNKKTFRKYIPQKTKANITTRNFPKTVEQIRKETKLLDGGDKYLFFTTNIAHKLIVIECEKY